MPDYRVKESSLTWKLAFRKILSVLPVPGTTEFENLFERLAPSGLRAEKYSVENPTGQITKLSEARVILSLLDDAIVMRIGYEGLEVLVPVVTADMYDAARAIAGIVLECLMPEAAAGPGTMTVQSFAHLELENGDAAGYLSEYFTIGDARVTPDAFALNLASLEASLVGTCRVVVARSLRYPGAVFIDYTATYPPIGPMPLSTFVDHARRDYGEYLAMIRLSLKVAPQ